MAALRLAARRLLVGRGPQAIYTAVVSPPAEVQRHILPRLIHSGRTRTVSPSSWRETKKNPPGAKPDAWPPHDEEKHLAMRSREKMEELYSMIDKELSSTADLDLVRMPQRDELRLLLMHISKHVDPKPTDGTWWCYRTMKALSCGARRIKGMLVVCYAAM